MGHAMAEGERACSARCRVAVHRHHDLGPDPFVHLDQLGAPGMAGDVDVRLLLGDDAHAEVRQLVHDPPDRDLVAGDDPGREDDGVVFAELQFVIAGRDVPRALRGSPCPPVAMINTSLRGRRIASSKLIGGGNSLRYPVDCDTRRIRSSERPAHLPLRLTRYAADRLQPRGVGREGRDQHPAVGHHRLREEALVDALRARGISWNTLVESHTKESTLPSPISVSTSVSGAAPHRGLVDLPVAGVENAAERSLDQQPIAFRDRMRQRDEADAERAELNAPAAPTTLSFT